MSSHTLLSRRPLPGGSRAAEGYRVTWPGTAVMGVINVTPDSFSDGGRYFQAGEAVARGIELAAAGARVLDVGGESTRPGAEPVPAEVEAERVVPVIRELVAQTGALISVDTSKAEVAREALAAGAHLVNDVGGLRDDAMLELCAGAGVPVVIMHMRGEPRTMQHRPRYDDVVAEVGRFLVAASKRALTAGVPDVIVDPGIGFGKTLEHNLALLRQIPSFAGGGAKVLVGVSRKRFIAALAGEVEPTSRDAGSLAAHLFAASRGAALVRAHDVAAHVQALRVWEGIHG